MHCSARYAKRKGCLSMADLRDLYQEVILDHTRRPRNFGRLAGANRCAEGFNPLCGDNVTVYLKLVDSVIEDARFEGNGCAISTASASLMTEALKGKTLDEVVEMAQPFPSKRASSIIESTSFR